MPVYEECKFYLHGGKCKHQDAPHPYESDCIGTKECVVYDDPKEYAAKSSENTSERIKGWNNGSWKSSADS